MPSSRRIREVLESEETIERLAAIEHLRWAHWQRYLHSRCESQADGSLVIPAELVARWESQIDTPYTHLTEPEKESDREQVWKYLSTVIETLTN
ncbi:hypothetical protein [Citricoccus sp. NR2]|uniref:hypothetical protein n=1 Tax=Citricoccus sp. NR2 TaxID=3004095 RepID=UPI0022DE1B80|nr:hypothetical protein [Citricoccus sp. NR2]WBL18299.1 hypothetical protein O1A05_10975 [Citricoccus sp. NR2]